MLISLTEYILFNYSTYCTNVTMAEREDNIKPVSYKCFINNNNN